MQLEIALQACLLILKRPPNEYDGWVEIIIYPGDFVIPREEMDENGVVHEYDRHRTRRSLGRRPAYCCRGRMPNTATRLP